MEMDILIREATAEDAEAILDITSLTLHGRCPRNEAERTASGFHFMNNPRDKNKYQSKGMPTNAIHTNTNAHKTAAFPSAMPGHITRQHKQDNAATTNKPYSPIYLSTSMVNAASAP